jgi:hypothetical protein
MPLEIIGKVGYLVSEKTLPVYLINSNLTKRLLAMFCFDGFDLLGVT